jgi:hypothetical protein
MPPDVISDNSCSGTGDRGSAAPVLRLRTVQVSIAISAVWPSSKASPMPGHSNARKPSDVAEEEAVDRPATARRGQIRSERRRLARPGAETPAADDVTGAHLKPGRLAEKAALFSRARRQQGPGSTGRC